MKVGQFVAAAVMLLSSAAAAQVPVDVSISGAGVFSRTVSSSSGTVTDKPTESVAVFGTIRYHFNRLHAAEINIGHTRNSQLFEIPPDTYRIISDITEFSGAYVFTPFSAGKWQPFLLGGVAGLRFSPGNTYIDQVQTNLGQTSATTLGFLYGVGTDYRVWGHLGVRLQYRGLLYKNPDFGVPSRFYTGMRSHMAEPAVGVVFKF